MGNSKNIRITYRLFIIAMMLYILAIGIYSLHQRGISIDDYGWHIRAGEQIVTNGKVDIAESLSWSVNGNDWINHEWLYDAILYAIAGLDVSKAAVFSIILHLVTLVVTLCYIRADKILFDSIPYIVVIAILSIVGIVSLNLRPNNMSLIIFTVLFIIIDKLIQNQNTKSIYLIPVLQIIICNIHASLQIIINIILVSILVISIITKSNKNIVNNFKKSTNIKILGIIVINFFVSFINPYGARSLSFANNFARISVDVTSGINEWKALDIKNIPDLLLGAIPIAIGIWALIKYSRKIHIQHIVVFVITTAMVFAAVRFWKIAVVSMLIMTYRYRPHFRVGSIEPVTNKDKNIVSVVTIAAAILLVIVSIKYINNNIGSSIFDKKDIEFINEHCGDRPFNHYNIGSELVRNNIRTFIDGRNDLFITYGIRDDHNIILDNIAYNSEKAREKLIEKYNFTSFIIESDSELAYWLENNGYNKIYIIKDKDEENSYGEYAIYK